MITEEELEQRINNSLDDKTKEIEEARAAIQKLDIEKIRYKTKCALDRLNEIFHEGGDRG